MGKKYKTRGKENEFWMNFNKIDLVVFDFWWVDNHWLRYFVGTYITTHRQARNVQINHLWFVCLRLKVPRWNTARRKILTKYPLGWLTAELVTSNHHTHSHSKSWMKSSDDKFDMGFKHFLEKLWTKIPNVHSKLLFRKQRNTHYNFRVIWM